MSYLVHFDLVEDLRLPGCPICRAGERAGRRYVSTLMVDDITDATACAAIRQAGGMCPQHVRQAMEVAAAEGDVMGAALLTELLVDIGEAALRKAGGRHRQRLLLRRNPERPCPACQAEGVATDTYVQLILDDPADYLGRMSATEGCGLCLPHAVELARLAPAEATRRQIAEAWLGQARRLRALAGELIQNLARQGRGETSTPSAALPERLELWRAAPQWLAGGRGVNQAGPRTRRSPPP